MSKRIGNEFDSYAREVMSVNTSSIQTRETKRAFFAGAAAMKMILLRDLSDGPNPTMQDMNTLFELEKELADILEGVSKGME